MADGLTGERELLKRWDRARKRVPEAAALALYALALDIIALAVQKTPVDTGRLRASNYVAPPVKRASGAFVVEAGFGTNYAVPVHERLDVSHVTGEAKFLEKAIREKQSGALAFAVRMAEKFVKSGVTTIPATAPTRPNVRDDEE